MKNLRYLPGVTTLALDASACTGCGTCVEVCPHGVLAVADGAARVVDRDGCMECGACAKNCPAEALRVNPGVGCAAYIVQSWFKGKDAACCGPADTCC